MSRRYQDHPSSLDQALENQSLQAVKSIYLGGIYTGPTGFATQTTQDILDYLYLTYWQVTLLDIKENDIATRRSYNSASLIESLYKQIDNGQIFATAARPS